MVLVEVKVRSKLTGTGNSSGEHQNSYVNALQIYFDLFVIDFVIQSKIWLRFQSFKYIINPNAEAMAAKQKKRLEIP